MDTSITKQELLDTAYGAMYGSLLEVLSLMDNILAAGYVDDELLITGTDATDANMFIIVQMRHDGTYHCSGIAI